MYLATVEIKESPINGKGVFTLSKIHRGDIIWKFDSAYDKTISIEEFEKLKENDKTESKRVAYLSATTNRYVYPPENDAARFTNHSDDNNLSVHIDQQISEEPYFIANRDIDIGEELTNNYLEFDDAIQNNVLSWMKWVLVSRSRQTAKYIE